jgi:hypothetical protein
MTNHRHPAVILISHPFGVQMSGIGGNRWYRLVSLNHRLTQLPHSDGNKWPFGAIFSGF